MPFNKLDHTASGKIRPRFKLETPEKKEDIMRMISDHAIDDPTITHSTYTRFIKLSIPNKDQHYWSPVLSLSFDQRKDTTIIRGVIGPKDKIWTMFMFFYIGISVLGMFASMVALVKWQMSDDMSLIFVIPLTIILLLSVFYTSKYGKVQAHTQTLHILRALRKAVDTVECVRIED